jgi:hypothetical protein
MGRVLSWGPEMDASGSSSGRDHSPVNWLPGQLALMSTVGVHDVDVALASRSAVKCDLRSVG